MPQLGSLTVIDGGLQFIGLHARTGFITKPQFTQGGRVFLGGGLLIKLDGLCLVLFDACPFKITTPQRGDGPDISLTGGL